MHRFLVTLLVFILTTTIAVAAPYADDSLTDQDFRGSDGGEAPLEPDVLNEIPQAISLAGQETPPSSNDAAPFPTDGITETDFHDNPGALLSDASGYLVIPETPPRGKCANNYYALYTCAGSSDLTKDAGTLAVLSLSLIVSGHLIYRKWLVC